MKTYLQRIIAALLIGATGVSCTTAYDAYGNPRPVVEPGTAALGIAAAGLAGYALANNRNDRHHRHYSRGYGYGYSGYRNVGYRPYYSRSSPYRYSRVSHLRHPGRSF